MTAAPRYKTLLVTPEHHARLLDLLARLSNRENHGTPVGLLRAAPGLTGRPRWAFDDAGELLAALEDS